MFRKAASFLLVGAFIVSPSLLSVTAQAQSKQDSGISENVKQQIASILVEKKNRVARLANRVGLPEDKLSLQMRAAVRQESGREAANGVQTLQYRAERDANNNVAVDIRGEATKNLLDAIAQNGGKVIFSSKKDNFIQAYLPMSAIELVAGQAEVKAIEFSRKGLLNETTTEETKQKLISNLTTKSVLDTPIFFSGSVDTQGNTTHRATGARLIFGVNGAGVKVGVISDSVRYLSRSQASGDLGNVTVIPGQSGVIASGGDTGEGTAMLEIIHDVAPSAQLYFATAFQNNLQNPLTFAANIRALKNAGCDIIVDDAAATFGPDGTPFQDVIVSSAINDVTAGGALYLSSAGNGGNKNDGTSGTWEGDFNPSGQTFSIGGETIGEFHDFSGTKAPGGIFDTVTASGGGLYLLWWADSFGTAASDYDVFLLSADGTQIIGGSAATQDGSPGSFPFEGFGVQDAVGQKIIITRFGNSPRRALHLVNERGRLAINTSGNVRGHNGAANALSIAATPTGPFQPVVGPKGPYPNNFNSSNEVERFSSDGPRRIFFNANNSAITPGNFLFSTNGGKLLSKVDLTGADGVSTTFPATSGLNPFFGTSAAAPHIAAIAALVKSTKPSLTRAQIITILNNSAIDIEAAGRDRDAGAGIVDAINAVALAKR